MPVDPLSIGLEVAAGVTVDALRERAQKWTASRKQWADVAHRAWLFTVERSGGLLAATAGAFEPQSLADWLTSADAVPPESGAYAVERAALVSRRRRCRSAPRSAAL